MTPGDLSISSFLFLAGIGQLVLVAGSLAIPRLLHWKDDLGNVPGLTRRVFWTYAGYIWATNLCFGLISTAAPQELASGTVLAACVSGFIAMYWGSRLVIQFAVFHRVKPAGGMFLMGEVALVGLFVFLTMVYAVAAALNLQSLWT